MKNQLPVSGAIPAPLGAEVKTAAQKALVHRFRQTFTVVNGDNGCHALTRLPAGSFSECVCSGANMSLLNGMDYLQESQLPDLYSSLPLLSLLGSARPNPAILRLETGANDSVARPFNPRELPVRIRAVFIHMHRPEKE
jgi:DNA-binding response OmpR family regulator